MTEAAPPTQVNNIYEFDVFPGLASTGGDLAGTGNGGTVTAIGTMGADGNITYTSVAPDSTAAISGTYLDFSVDSSLSGGGNGTPDNTASNSPIPDAQAVIDAIQANETNATPLSDTFYYQVTNASGTTTDSVQLNLEDVEENGNGAPFTTPATVANGSTTNIGGFSFDKPLATGQADGADQTETLSVTLSLNNNSGSEGSLFIDPSEVGSFANTGETISFDTGNDAVTITGQIQAINSDLQGLSYIAPTSDGSDAIFAHATDGPTETPVNVVGNIVTTIASTTISNGSPVPVDNSYTQIFQVNDNNYGFGTEVPGFGTGDTLIAISGDDTNFTLLNGGSVSIDGTFVNFSLDASQSYFNEGLFIIQGNQSLIDQIQATDAAYQSDPTTPALTDNFYYQLVDLNGSTITNEISVPLDDFYTNGTGTPFSSPVTTQAGATIAIPGFSVDKYTASDQTTDADDLVSVTLSTFNFNDQLTEGTLYVDMTEAGAVGGSATITDYSGVEPHGLFGPGLTITGSIAAVNADLAALHYVASTTLGQNSIAFSYQDGPVSNTGALIGNIDVECFLTGTRIRTPQGAVAVQDLRAGDLVATLHSGPQPIKAVQRLGFTGAAQFRSAQVRPICIAAGALGPNTPSRDLYISPDHAMFLDGALVPAKLLLNGSSITQPARHAAITYIHIELAPHGIIFAEDAATETYLDIGKGAAITSLDPFEPKSWEDACAPLLLAGPALAAIRARLASRAAKFFRSTSQISKAA